MDQSRRIVECGQQEPSPISCASFRGGSNIRENIKVSLQEEHGVPNGRISLVEDDVYCARASISTKAREFSFALPGVVRTQSSPDLTSFASGGIIR